MNIFGGKNNLLFKKLSIRIFNYIATKKFLTGTLSATQIRHIQNNNV